MEQHAVVVGAGAFGGWTAWFLRERGYRVTLVDGWGPGNALSSSGGESRVVRANYGAMTTYVPLGSRALQLWEEFQGRWGVEIFRKCGFLWMQRSDEEGARASLDAMANAGVRFDELSAAAGAARFQQIYFDDIAWAIYEPNAGYVLARRACAVVVERLQSAGGVYLRGHVGRVEEGSHPGEALRLDGARELAADVSVFACGAWLPELFPETLGGVIRPSRQDMCYLAEPRGEYRFADNHCPTWYDAGPGDFYGVPGNESRGFKVGEHVAGETVDPTTMERVPDPAYHERVREFVAHRFPALKDAPVAESRVCQYENTPDSHFILDRHPHADNVWLLGGGSGHGFKHGPAIGELAAACIAGEGELWEDFRLERATLK